MISVWLVLLIGQIAVAIVLVPYVQVYLTCSVP